jgi:hypothetical protein
MHQHLPDCIAYLKKVNADLVEALEEIVNVKEVWTPNSPTDVLARIERGKIRTQKARLALAKAREEQP